MQVALSLRYKNQSVNSQQHSYSTQFQCRPKALTLNPNRFPHVGSFWCNVQALCLLGIVSLLFPVLTGSGSLLPGHLSYPIRWTCFDGEDLRDTHTESVLRGKQWREQ